MRSAVHGLVETSHVDRSPRRLLTLTTDRAFSGLDPNDVAPVSVDDGLVEWSPARSSQSAVVYVLRAAGNSSDDAATINRG